MKTKTIFDPRYKGLVAEIIKIRKARGISQAKLAQLVGWPNTSVARTELRERRLDFIDAVDLLKAIGLSKAEIIRVLEKFI